MYSCRIDVQTSFLSTMAEQTINIPQIIAVVLVGFFAIRWFLSSSSNSQSSSRNAGRQINPAHVDQIMGMFPQLDRRTVMWDLQRNGGSVQATTERVLSGRSLDTVSGQASLDASRLVHCTTDMLPSLHHPFNRRPHSPHLKHYQLRQDRQPRPRHLYRTS